MWTLSSIFGCCSKATCGRSSGARFWNGSSRTRTHKMRTSKKQCSRKDTGLISLRSSLTNSSARSVSTRWPPSSGICPSSNGSLTAARWTATPLRTTWSLTMTFGLHYIIPEENDILYPYIQFIHNVVWYTRTSLAGIVRGLCSNKYIKNLDYCNGKN